MYIHGRPSRSVTSGLVGHGGPRPLDFHLCSLRLVEARSSSRLSRPPLSPHDGTALGELRDRPPPTGTAVSTCTAVQALVDQVLQGVPLTGCTRLSRINVARATSARPLLTRRSLSQDHEWVKMDGDIGTIGITNHAQEQLGDVVFVELPEIGLTIEKDDTMGAVESVKAASDIYAPVSGAQAAASPQG